MTACLLTSDLAFSSHVVHAAGRAGVTIEVVMDVQQLCTRCQAGDVALVILDLSHPGLDPAGVVARLREAGAAGMKLIAFGPHVQAAKLAAAREAGCEEVFTRGQFHSQVAAILTRYLSE